MDTYEPPRSVAEWRTMYQETGVSPRSSLRPATSQVAQQALDTAYQVAQTIDVTRKSIQEIFVLIAELDLTIASCPDRVLQSKLMAVEERIREALLRRLERYIGQDGGEESWSSQGWRRK